MDTVTLGRTGLEVSVAGLGCGGHSRLGQAAGLSEEHSVALVGRALDAGVTFIDTARAYGTESIVGKALAGRRDEVVVSSKAWTLGREGPITAADLRESVRKSLRRLQTDRIDVFHLHGVLDEQYDHCRDELVPELVRLRDEGAIRFLAISEQFGGDPGHVMLQRAVPDGIWDVVMVGFNPLNPSARERVLRPCIERDVGVLVMFAVRRALSNSDVLRDVVARLVESGHVGAGAVDADDPLGFLVGSDDGLADSVVEACYRFSRHEPGTHVVLTGTGNPDHLDENLTAINRPALSAEVRARLRELFGQVDHISAD